MESLFPPCYRATFEILSLFGAKLWCFAFSAACGRHCRSSQITQIRNLKRLKTTVFNFNSNLEWRQEERRLCKVVVCILGETWLTDAAHSWQVWTPSNPPSSLHGAYSDGATDWMDDILRLWDKTPLSVTPLVDLSHSIHFVAPLKLTWICSLGFACV